MRALSITLVTLYLSVSLHATSAIPQELEEISKRRIKTESNYPEFKKSIGELVENLQSLRQFAKQELRELTSDIDFTQEKKVAGFISDIIALLSQPKIKDDEATLQDIRAFYSSPKTGDDKYSSASCETERKEKVIDVIARASLPITKLLHAQSSATSTMMEQLDILHTRHNTYVHKGCLVARDSTGIPFLNLLAITKRFLQKAYVLFWLGERMVVDNFLKIDPKNTGNHEVWKRETDDWNGPSQNATAAVPPSSGGLKERVGISTQLRIRMLKASTAVFKHQLTGFYMNGWRLHDIAIALPEFKPVLVAYGRKIDSPILEASFTHFISLEERIQWYDRSRGAFSKGIFSYADSADMLNALDAFFEKGHVMKLVAMKQEAMRQVEDLKIRLVWRKYEQEKKQEETTTSINIFVQGAIEEKKHRFENFDPESIVTTNTEGQQRAKLITILLNDAHIRSHLPNSSLYEAILHYSFITKTFDILDDSWIEGHRSNVTPNHRNRIQTLFRKSYCALQESYSLIQDHLFLFYERHPLTKNNTLG